MTGHKCMPGGDERGGEGGDEADGDMPTGDIQPPALNSW